MAHWPFSGFHSFPVAVSARLKVTTVGWVISIEAVVPEVGAMMVDPTPVGLIALVAALVGLPALVAAPVGLPVLVAAPTGVLLLLTAGVAVTTLKPTTVGAPAVLLGAAGVEAADGVVFWPAGGVFT